MLEEQHPTIDEERFSYFPVQPLRLDPIDRPGKILDIGGGGDGIMGRLHGSRVVAIDPDGNELREAAAGPSKVIMNAARLGFADKTFETVTSFFTLLYIPETIHLQVFVEVKRVLKPKGKFLIWDGILPERDHLDKDVAVFPLEIEMPNENISTGYGSLWPRNGRNVDYYLALVNAAGFVPTAKRVMDAIVQLELTPA